MKLGALLLTVLCYNVHGLLDLLVDDDPASRMPEIGRRLNAYDVALVQESWSYFDSLTAQATHGTVERNGGVDTGFLFQTGLATFARPRLRAVTRGSLGACAGWLDRANDCFADKGFLRVRLALENGAELDFWNLHLDAGDDPSDRAARDAQLRLLAERVQKLSGAGALVVAGDFNLDESEPADRVLLERFTRALALSDSGARAAADGPFAHKRIDFILYRSGAGAALEPESAGEAREFSAGPTPLSDHPALFARLRVSPASGP
ncbi:MAG: endonuclease/exonuclease/phosphatase family protein [Myxococcota bacterium]